MKKCWKLLLTAVAVAVTMMIEVDSSREHYYEEHYRRSLLANGLASTPPMGWNSWNHFGCQIDEKIIKKTADALVSTGLAKLGYIYVNIGLTNVSNYVSKLLIKWI
ncbi:hypothetical protein ACFE04_031068 [Oxalis oulophora]